MPIGRLAPPPRCCLSLCCEHKGGLLSFSEAADTLIWGCLTILFLCLPQALRMARVDDRCRWLFWVLMRCSVVSVDPVLQSAATSGYWVSDGIFCFLLAHSFQIVWYVITMCASSCQNRTRSFMDVKEGPCHNSLSLWPDRFGAVFALLALFIVGFFPLKQFDQGERTLTA